MTISPPSNVKTPGDGPFDPVRVLAHGIDALVLAIYVKWDGPEFFQQLQAKRQEAEAKREAVADALPGLPGETDWVFNVQPHGANGYAWLLVSHECTLKVGSWLKPQTRPSVMAEIRSETLWARGVGASVERVCALLESAGGRIDRITVSRADLCVDVMVPEKDWHKDLIDFFVTRAQDVALYLKRGQLTGIQIGKGEILARFYDKPLEIATQSHKDWMYGIWGIEKVPEGHKVIRVEYQLRREKLGELGIDSFEDLQAKSLELWAYCTQKWLKLQHNADKHHTQQTTLEWWKTVQDGHPGAANAHALVIEQAIKVQEKQLLAQIKGLWSSLIALKARTRELHDESLIEVNRQVCDLLDGLDAHGLNDQSLTDDVRKKLAKYRRAMEQDGGASAQAAEGDEEPPL